MSNKQTILIAAALLIITFNCCSENPFSGENSQSGIFGKVTDEAGNPIEGVNIHYIPEIIEYPLNTLKKPLPSTQINFLFRIPAWLIWLF